MPIERKVTQHLTVQSCVTVLSLRDGIVWWELQEQKCQQHVCQQKRCGTDWSGWLSTAHPTVKDGKVKREVCFSDRFAGCKYSNNIFVKNCGSYFIYKLQQPPTCNSRYCGTDCV